MSDRQVELHALANDIHNHDRIADAWLVKSFTDRVIVVELASGDTLPEAIVTKLIDADLEPYNDLHDVPADAAAFAGDVADTLRFQFVDLETRGILQSYVVE